MATTTNKGLFEPAVGTNSWDIPLNANFSVIDTAFGSSLEIDVTGITTTQTLLTIDYQNFYIVFTGTLSVNLTYQIPSGVGGQWLIGNSTSGAYTISIKNATSGSNPIVIPAGQAISICSTGSNVYKFGTTGLLSNSIGVFGGGFTTAVSSVMDYITIATTGNATTFGNLTVARSDLAGTYSSTRGVFGGGTTGSTSTVMDYITIATTGNAASFGNLTAARQKLAGVSSATRGVFGGGTTSSAVMDYITIATIGNATSFGNLTVSRESLAGVSSSTIGVFGGGKTTGGGAAVSAVMDYITIATTGNATTFGNLTLARESLAGVSNGTRGVFGGGFTTVASAIMDYITIETTGNATSFGNLTVARYTLAGVSSATRGVLGGGNSSSAVMDYIIVDTTGNATSFGNLTVGRSSLSGVSSFSPS